MFQHSLSSRIASLSPVLMVLTLLIVPRAAVAQSSSSMRPGPATTADSLKTSSAVSTETPAINLDERLKLLEDDLRQQNKTVVEMRALIAEQQRLIEMLSAKVADTKTAQPVMVTAA